MSKLKECLFGKTINPCTWLQHSIIAILVTTGLSFLIQPLLFISPAIIAFCVSIFFIWKELQGPGDLPGYHKGFFKDDFDRVMDWLTPTISSFLTASIFIFDNSN